MSFRKGLLLFSLCTVLLFIARGVYVSAPASCLGETTLHLNRSPQPNEVVSSSEQMANSSNKAAPRIAIATLFVNHIAESAGSDEHRMVSCTRSKNRAYAEIHHYAFFNEANFSMDEALPQLPHQKSSSMPHNEGRFQKLRFLIQVCETHPEIDWVMWLDADAVITDLRATIEEKLLEFEHIHRKRQLDKIRNTNMTFVPLSVVMGSDGNGINSGVFLIRNNELGRRFLITSHLTYVDPNDGLADQKAITDAFFDKPGIHNQRIYRSFLLLTDVQSAPLVRFRGSTYRLNQPGYWKHEDSPWVL